MQTSHSPPSNPLERLSDWLKQSRKTGLSEPWAMVLSTSNQGEVSSRVVLLKELTEEGGLLFYTNYESQKGLELAQNPKAALNFYWDELKQQVRLQGTVKKTSRESSENYWRSRPRASQLSQYLSLQSQPLPEGGSLREIHKSCEEKFRSKEIPCPANWGGYELTPYRIEFWLSGDNRLHQRWNYELKRGGWEVSCLYP